MTTPYTRHIPRPAVIDIERLAGKLDILATMIERLTGEMVGLRLELAALRERWESGAENPLGSP